MNKKVLTYDYDKMKRAGILINSLSATGCQNFRVLAELADILDSGVPGEVFEKGGDDSGMDEQEI